MAKVLLLSVVYFCNFSDNYNAGAATRAGRGAGRSLDENAPRPNRQSFGTKYKPNSGTVVFQAAQAANRRRETTLG